MMHNVEDKHPLSAAAELEERHWAEIRWFDEFLDRHARIHEDRTDFSAALRRAVSLGIDIEEMRRVFEVNARRHGVG